LQAQVIANPLRNAQVQETGIGKGIDLDRQGRDARIAQENRAHEQEQRACPLRNA
jgi:hypothetical protein